MQGFEFNNQLSDPELERLAILGEEAAEIGHIVCKTIRHGYSSFDPTKDTAECNRHLIEKEIADLLFALELMYINGDLDEKLIEYYLYEKKRSKTPKYLHHQSNLPKVKDKG